MEVLRLLINECKAQRSKSVLPTRDHMRSGKVQKSIHWSIQTLLVTLVVDLPHHQSQKRLVLPSLTFVLWLRAGNDPFDQAALHQSFPREARLLPLPRILHSTWRRLDAIGISQQAAIDHLAIRLEGINREGERDQVNMEIKYGRLRF